MDTKELKNAIENKISELNHLEASNRVAEEERLIKEVVNSFLAAMDTCIEAAKNGSVYVERPVDWSYDIDKNQWIGNAEEHLAELGFKFNSTSNGSCWVTYEGNLS